MKTVIAAAALGLCAAAGPAFSLDLTDIKEAVQSQTGSPGVPFGDYTVLLDQELEGGVSVLAGCSSGKKDGLGADFKDGLAGAIDSIPAPFPLNLARNTARRKIENGALSIDEGEGFCFAVAHQAGQFKRAKGLRNGSIYVTSWKDGKIVDQRTDSRFCRNLSANIACFEVVELPAGSSAAVDGVSGCFHTEINGKLKSVSFGRGASIPGKVSDTFAASASVSDDSCLARGLGADKKD